MLNKLRSNTLVSYLMVMLAYTSTVLMPIRVAITQYSYIPIAISTLGVGSSVFYSPKLYAGGQSPSLRSDYGTGESVDLEAVKSKVSKVNSETRTQFDSGSAAETEKQKEFLFGKEEDRKYGGMVESDSWDDSSIKNRGALYENQLQGDKESPEGQAYQLLNGVFNDDGFATRDRDNQTLGDKMTLVDVGDDENFLTKFQETSDELSDGMICKTEIVKPAIYRQETVYSDESCSDNSGDAYIQGECTITRDIRVPTLQGDSISQSVINGGFKRRFTSTESSTVTFKAEDLEKFSDNWYLEFTNNYGDDAEFEYIVNGSSTLKFQDDIDNSRLVVPKSLFTEGENTIRADVHPIGYAGADDIADCGTEDLLWIGWGGGQKWVKLETHYDPTAGEFGGDVTTTHPHHTRDYLACKDRRLYILRTIVGDGSLAEADTQMNSYREEFDADSCVSYDRSSQHEYPFGSFGMARYPYKSETRYRTVYTGTHQDDFSTTEEPYQFDFYAWKGCISFPLYDTEHKLFYRYSQTYKDGDTGWPGWNTKYNHYLLTSGGSFTSSRARTSSGNHSTYNHSKPFYCTDTLCTYDGRQYSLAWKEELNFKLEVDAESFYVNSFEESIKNCSTADNVSIQRSDGAIVSGLPGKFVAVDGVEDDGVSNSRWECLDSSASRQVGSLSNTLAETSEIGEALPDFYEDIDESNAICYQARARNFVINIASAPLCPSGGLECYLTAVPDPSASPASADYSLGSVTSFLQNGANCNVVREKSNCALKSDTCQIISPISGDCLRSDKVYQCSDIVETLLEPAVTKKSCESTFPCLEGEDEFCTYEEESSESFQDAALQLSIGTFARGDQECFGDTSDSCMLFAGEQKKCRSGVLYGAESCCKDPGTVSTMDYIHALYAVYKIDYVETTVDGVMNNYIVDPMMEYVVDPTMEFAGKVAENVYGSFESLIADPGNATKAVASQTVTPAGTVAAQQGEQLVTGGVTDQSSWSFASMGSNMAEWGAKNLGSLGEWMFDGVVKDIGGNAIGTVGTGGVVNVGGVEYASKEAFEEATGQAVTESWGASGALQATFGYIMLAYQIYSIAKLLYELATQCSADEVATSSDIAVGNCTFMDKRCTSDTVLGCNEETKFYCCYKSPLARIIHEQAIKTGQHPFSNTASHYDEGMCRGLWFSELREIDFDHPDFSLDEWVGMLMDINKMPDPDELDTYFEEDHLTKSVARHYEVEDEVGNATERSVKVVSAMDDVEEIRRMQREFLLAQKNYDSAWRACGYIHNLPGGTSFDGREEFSNYPDGRQVILNDCERDPDGNVYPHQYQSCTPRLEPILDDDGVDTGEFESIPRWTVYFIGATGQREVVSTCTDSDAVNLAANTGDAEWRSCGYHHQIANARSVEKVELVRPAVEGQDEVVLIGCSVQPQSRVFDHEDTPCGFATTVARDTEGRIIDTGNTKQKWSKAFLDQSGDLVTVTQCDVRDTFPVYPHEWKKCGYFHDEEGQLSTETFKLIFEDFLGAEHDITTCGVQPFSKSFEHEFDVDSCSILHDPEKRESFSQYQQWVELPDEGAVNIGVCKPVQSDRYPHEFESCGWENDLTQNKSFEKLQQYVEIDGIRTEFGECEIKEVFSDSVDFEVVDCSNGKRGVYSHDFTSGKSRVFRKLAVYKPGVGYEDLSGCLDELTLEYDHQFEECPVQDNCRWYDFGCSLTPATTTYFIRTDKSADERVNVALCVSDESGGGGRVPM